MVVAKKKKKKSQHGIDRDAYMHSSIWRGDVGRKSPDPYNAVVNCLSLEYISDNYHRIAVCLFQEL